jgi:hypothetical protein
LITVKAYPTPSKNYLETVCTAGITEGGNWIRLHPIAYRHMPYGRWFKKYQWIEAMVKRHEKDFRIDSYRLDEKSIRLGKKLPLGDWKERKKIVLPTASQSLEEIIKKYQDKRLSLGIFKPKEIFDFKTTEDKSDWGPQQKKLMAQLRLFGDQPKPLQKIPWKFTYTFKCDDKSCKGHSLSIRDWEIFVLYKKLFENEKYAIDEIMSKMKARWLDEIWGPDRDSYLIVGSVFPRPSFVVLGVFWPPKTSKKTD